MKEPKAVGFDDLLNVLTTRQHLAPHESLKHALTRLISELGVCAQAIEQSLQRLQVDPQQSIGRLRRTEILQLARTIHRVWQQRATDVAATMSP